jgi:hypothetical protein
MRNWKELKSTAATVIPVAVAWVLMAVRAVRGGVLCGHELFGEANWANRCTIPPLNLPGSGKKVGPGAWL